VVAVISINEFSRIIKKVVGYTGQLVFDADKPRGSPKKLMNSERLFNPGWKPEIGLEDGLNLAYRDFLLRRQYNY
jgi:GDP-L-fucose synthase